MFKVTARTVLELGSELISSDAIAFYELIKNGLDAGTKDGVTISFDIVLPRKKFEEVRKQIKNAFPSGTVNSSQDSQDFEKLKDWIADKLITQTGDIWDDAARLIGDTVDPVGMLRALEEIRELSTITISDTGSGMSLDQLNSLFLVIGTPSRRNYVYAAISDGSVEAPYLGEKGIGRLSTMRLGDRLSVLTARSHDKRYNLIDIDWSAFEDTSKLIEDITVKPRRGAKKSDPDYSGTKIRIRRLKSDWAEKRVERLASDDFSLIVNPLGKRNHRIAVFWNRNRLPIKRLDRDFLSHANALIRGKYRVTDSGPALELRTELNNIGFDHPKETNIEMITADDLHSALVGLRDKRGRMNKRDTDYTALQSVGPFEFELYWFNRSIIRKEKPTGDYRALLNLLEQWMGVRLYRDGFRVYPYGSEEDDWLELDRTALRSKGYALNRIQLVGQVEIGRLSNPELIDQTNREGLRHNPEEVILKETVQFAVERLRDEMNRITIQQKDARKLVVLDETRTNDLETRMKRAVREIGKVVPSEHREVVQNLELMREEFSRYAAESRTRIADMEKDADQMVVMAGVGLMVEVVAHELTRSAENALDILNGLKRKSVPEEVRRQLESLRASMNSINKRLRILDPLSVTGRQRKERFKLDELINQIVEAHEAQFERHNVKPNVLLPKKSVELSAVKGMVVQVLENLISNSIYWMDVEKQRKLSSQPEITIEVEDSPPRIRFSDSGPGVSEQYKEKIFDLFFSLKDKSHRRGLGLFIAREAAEHNGGALTLDPDSTNKEGRYTTFDYQVVGDES